MRRNYGAAQANFRTALRLRPDDRRLRARLALCHDVLALDPTRRGLAAAQRYARSLALVALARDSLARCPHAGGVPVAADVPPTTLPTATARDAATDANVDLAERLWESRKAACAASAPSPSDERLALVLNQTAQ